MSKNVCLILFSLVLSACDNSSSAGSTRSSSGARRMVTSVATDAEGHTAEQLSVASKLQKENVIGGLQYVYVLSPYSGEIIYLDTAQGKVTSSGKRNSPKTVAAGYESAGDFSSPYGIGVQIGGENYVTSEVLGDDGTYGDSCEYLYWTSTDGSFHRQYVTAGVVIHVSDRPMRFGHVTQTVEVSTQNNNK